MFTHCSSSWRVVSVKLHVICVFSQIVLCTCSTHVIVDLITHIISLEDACFVNNLQAVWFPSHFAKYLCLKICFQAPSICFLPLRQETKFQTLTDVKSSLFWDATRCTRAKASATPRWNNEVSCLKKF